MLVNSSGLVFGRCSHRWKMLGQASSVVGGLRVSVSTTVSGSEPPITTTLAGGSANCAKVQVTAREWMNAMHEAMVSSGRVDRNGIGMVSSLVSTRISVFGECTTSLGTPVVPEVWVHSIGSSSGRMSGDGMSAPDRSPSATPPGAADGSPSMATTWVSGPVSLTPAEAAAASTEPEAITTFGSRRFISVARVSDPKVVVIIAGSAPILAEAAASRIVSRWLCLMIAIRSPRRSPATYRRADMSATRSASPVGSWESPSCGAMSKGRSRCQTVPALRRSGQTVPRGSGDVGSFPSEFRSCMWGCWNAGRRPQLLCMPMSVGDGAGMPFTGCR